MRSPQKSPAFANVTNLLQITREGGNEFQLFTSLKNSFLFRHNYLATSKKGTIDCRAELAFCCIGFDNCLHRYTSTSRTLTHLKCKLQLLFHFPAWDPARQSFARGFSKRLPCLYNTRARELPAGEREGARLPCFGRNFGCSHLHAAMLRGEDYKDGLEMWLRWWRHHLGAELGQ